MHSSRGLGRRTKGRAATEVGSGSYFELDSCAVDESSAVEVLLVFVMSSSGFALELLLCVSTLLLNYLRCYSNYYWALERGICTSYHRPNSCNVLSFSDSAIELIDATIFSIKICRTECGPVKRRHMSLEAVSKFSYFIFRRLSSALQTFGVRYWGRIS